MFDDLTITELDELSDILCNAIDHGQRFTYGPDMIEALQTVEHEVWHTRCRKSRVRCLQCPVSTSNRMEVVNW